VEKRKTEGRRDKTRKKYKRIAVYIFILDFISLKPYFILMAFILTETLDHYNIDEVSQCMTT
jgi:hypothetical protein